MVNFVVAVLFSQCLRNEKRRLEPENLRVLRNQLPIVDVVIILLEIKIIRLNYKTIYNTIMYQIIFYIKSYFRSIQNFMIHFNSNYPGVDGYLMLLHDLIKLL